MKVVQNNDKKQMKTKTISHYENWEMINNTTLVHFLRPIVSTSYSIMLFPTNVSMALFH